jgi:hypothetical protein
MADEIGKRLLDLMGYYWSRDADGLQRALRKLLEELYDAKRRTGAT